MHSSSYLYKQPPCSVYLHKQLKIYRDMRKDRAHSLDVNTQDLIYFCDTRSMSILICITFQ